MWTRLGVSVVTASWLALSCTTAASAQLDVAVGFAGVWKVGHDCPLQITLGGELAEEADRIDITTVDGDGVPVVYTWPVEGQSVVKPLVRIGRSVADLKVTVLAADKPLSEKTLAFEAEGAPLSSDQPFVVTVGSPMGVQQLSRSDSSGASSTFSTASLMEANTLPTQWQAYSSCDLVIVCTDDREFLSSISDLQWQALDTWLRRGGGVVLTLGGELASLPEVVKSWIPGKYVGNSRINNPGAIESLVATDKPIRTIEATQLEIDRGEVLLSMADSFGRDVPWWVSVSHGHGIVQLLTSSLDSAAFAEWPDRRLLWQQVVEPYVQIASSQSEQRGSVGDASYLGYSDLVGQLRATLDVFPGVKVMSFSQFAAILIGILVLVGPIDYLVSVRWLGRPHVSWYFSGFCLVLASVGLTWVYQSMRPRELRINTAQIVDIDTTNGRLAGRLWGHVYSGAATTVNVGAVATGDSSPSRVDWQGLPGRGLGGFESQLNADRGMPKYEIVQAADGGNGIRGVGIPAAGTKCVFATWESKLESLGNSQLVEIAGVDQVTGELVNPLSVDLIDPALFYHNWYYSLNSRIPAGGTFTISYDVIPKDITRRLNRRQVVEDSDVVTPWDPADRNSLDRLLELMMFYRSASGKSYTSLSHRYHTTLDQSNLMDSDQAVLIGRVESPFAKLNVTQQETASAVEVHQDVERTWCRILVPVKPAK